MSEEKPSIASLEVPQWTCQLTPQETPLTVGSLQTLVCSGDPVTAWQADKIKIQFEDQVLDYSLSILKKESVDHQALTLITTSYKSGNFNQPHFLITDGVSSVKVMDLSWKVESVLQGQEDKPIPSMGPLTLSLPWWYWSGIAFLAILILSVVVLKAKKMWDRKKLIEELMTQATALTPFNQFNKDMRTHVRAWQQVEILGKKTETIAARVQVVELAEKTFKQYLMRELLIPALDGSQSEILKEIKKRYSTIYEVVSSDLIKIFREFSEIKKGKGKNRGLSQLDCEQLVGMAKKTADHIHQIKSRRKS